LIGNTHCIFHPPFYRLSLALYCPSNRYNDSLTAIQKQQLRLPKAQNKRNSLILLPLYSFYRRRFILYILYIDCPQKIAL